MSNRIDSISPSNSIGNFKISALAGNGLMANILNIFDPLIEKILGLDKIKKIYSENLQGLSDEEFSAECLRQVDAKLKIRQKELAFIPKIGPVIIVANHPYGGLDGVILHSLLRQVRSDFKILVNNVLSAVPELRENFILVDAFNKNSKANINGFREALRHLQKGGLVVIFPAGEVSNYKFTQMKITDSTWSESVARLVKMTGANVVPVHFSGANSFSFQLAGMLHPVLRTLLLPRELLKKGRKIRVRIGEPINAKLQSEFPSSEAFCRFLRLKTYLLDQHPKDLINERKKKQQLSKNFVKIGNKIDELFLKNDIDSLPSENKLFDNGDFVVCYGNLSQLPNVILEVGRLREITFRNVGEGSGKEYDLDRFDNHYYHLVVWNKVKNEVVGAYRFAMVDRVVNRHGFKGLYTNAFYKYSEDFKDKLMFGIELGRSFVRYEYQKQYTPLLLLWKGICRFIALNPRYHLLFGAVSVSGVYSEKSRYLLANLLLNQNNEVKVRKKFRCKISGDADLKTACQAVDLASINLMSNLIKGVEKDKDVPILIKQYMKLGGKFYSFSVDHEFAHCLDGLIVVDLLQSSESSLYPYMGDDLPAYFKYHKG